MKDRSTENDCRPTRSRAPSPRGRRRRDQILATAGPVFAEVGYERATTNLIAQRAGISPGSLYQFFRNKQDIAEALAENYVQQLTEVQETGLGPMGAEEADLAAFVTRSVREMVRFNADNPGFLALFMRADAPPGLRAAIEPLQRLLSARTHEVLAAHAPDKPDTELALYTLVSLQIARGIMPVIAAADDPPTSPLVAELERAIRSYLAEVLR